MNYIEIYFNERIYSFNQDTILKCQPNVYNIQLYFTKPPILFKCYMYIMIYIESVNLNHHLDPSCFLSLRQIANASYIHFFFFSVDTYYLNIQKN